MADRGGFPERYARTRGFSLGRPRSLRVAPDGRRILFLRSVAGDDPRTALWCREGTDERLLADPRALAGDSLTAAERARRERVRETAEGITSYSTDRDLDAAAFVLGGRLYVVEVGSGHLTEEAAQAGAFDPRLSPDGAGLTHVAAGGVWVAERGDEPRLLVGGGEEEGVSWGQADFLAAEEMGRTRGHWWSPDGEVVAACRVDERRVLRWYLGDPARPEREPRPHRYPAAGTVNPSVRLALLAVGGGAPVAVDWDREALPYLPRVVWRDTGPLTLLVQSRDQRHWQVLVVDGDTGATTAVREDRDDAWLGLVPGVPAWLGGDRLVMVLDTDRGPGGTRSVVVDGRPVSPPGLQVDRVVRAAGDSVWFTGSRDPVHRHLHRWDAGTGEVVALTSGSGVHDGVVGGGTVVVTGASLDEAPSVRIPATGRRLSSAAEAPVVEPAPELLVLGERELRAALLRPGRGPAAEGDGPLPVILDPYGGPHAQRVTASRHAYLTAQWLADQGYLVLVVDGRGTPGRGPAWERAVRGDLAGPVLADQVDALEAAARHEPRLDLDRVAIRGWSFGGYLAALAVLRRPDVFRAGIAGAPVADWRLYDTHYTERYLGHPDEHPGAYRRSSLVDGDGGLVGAVPPGRPTDLLIIHGLADDNVVAAHSLRLSAALLAAGRRHRFLPLPRVTHMTPTVAAELLGAQVDFLADTVGGAAQAPGP